MKKLQRNKKYLGGISEVINIPVGDITIPAEDCNYNNGKIKAVLFVSKYMIKKYGFTEALNRIIERKNKKIYSL